MTAPQFDQGRLAQVLVEPIVSEKATSVAESHNQVLFKVLNTDDQSRINQETSAQVSL